MYYSLVHAFFAEMCKACSYTLLIKDIDHEAAYKEAHEATNNATKDILAIADANRNRCGNLHSYDKVNTLLLSDFGSNTSSPTDSCHVVQREITKKKRKSMRELKMYTGGGSAKKSKRDGDNFKGWSHEGKMFMVKMTKDIKQDVDSGMQAEWEKMYRRICMAVKVSDEQEQESCNETEVDYDIMYCKV